MKILVFCNNEITARIVFELIRKRMFLGIVIPSENIALIKTIKDSGYVLDEQIFAVDIKNEEEIKQIIKTVKPDLCFVLTFPIIFKNNLLNLPPLGFINFHFGSLPEYRSADPIFWQLRNQESKGRLSVHKMNEQIDAGPILFQEDVNIHYSDTYGSLLHKFANMTTSNIDKIIELIEGNNDCIPQQESKSKYFPKPIANDVYIDWKNMDISEINAIVNACNPWNKGALTMLDDLEVRIMQITPADYEKELPDEPGKIFFADEKQGVFVICKDQKLIRLDAIHTSLGYAIGGKILNQGIIIGKSFNDY